MIALLLVLIVAAYLLGSIPFGVVLTKFFSSTDITKEGSGNIGATNVLRQAGPMLGVATLACDMAKGALPVVLGFYFLYLDGNFEFPIQISLIGLAAFLGHLFPVYTGFKQGGKGVATAAGVFLVLAPLALVGALVVFAAAVGVTRRASVGSLAASASLAPLVYWFYQSPSHPVTQWPSHPVAQSPSIAILALVIAILVWVAHRENIKRLLSGQEPKIL